MENVKGFNMSKKPVRQRWFLMPLVWGVSYLDVWGHKAKIEKRKMKDLKPPYLLLCNHNSFLDFKIATVAIFPYRANYVVAIDGFLGKEWLLRNAGGICKRKFTDDITLVKQLRQVIHNGNIAVVYPEARYSLCGTGAILPPSLGKLAKVLKVPVVTLITKGHHVNSPFWNTKNRGVKNIESTLEQIVTMEEVKSLSYQEINKRIKQAFTYDDYAWQKGKGLIIGSKNRAKGLHKVLYKCPNCYAENEMDTSGCRLFCKSCKKEWEMTELGQLKATEGETIFSHIPDWYEWEREKVKEEIQKGTYHFSSDVLIRSLPNAKHFILLGKGKFTHSMEGFSLTYKYLGKEIKEVWDVKALYSCHIEFNYLNKFGDCVDLNTLQDTYYIYPLIDKFSVTKISLATEELFLANEEKRKNM